MTIYATINSQGAFQLATKNHKDVYTFTDCNKFEDIAKINKIIKIDFFKRILAGERTFSINDYVDND